MLSKIQVISNGCPKCFPKWSTTRSGYVEQPKGFVDPHLANHVYKLKKV